MNQCLGSEAHQIYRNFLKYLGTKLLLRRASNQNWMPFWKTFVNQQVIGFNTKQLGVIAEPVIYNMNSNSFILGINLVNYWLSKKLAELMVYLPRDTEV